MTSSIGGEATPNKLQIQSGQAVDGEMETTATEVARETAQAKSASSLQDSEDPGLASALKKYEHKKLESSVKPRVLQRIAEGKSVQEVATKEEGDQGQFKDTNQETAQQFQKNNPQLKADNLLDLRGKIQRGATKEQILGELAKLYPNKTDLQIEALKFLVQTTIEPKEKERIGGILEEFQEINAKLIAKDLEISAMVLKGGVADPIAVRNMHQSMTHDSPRDFNQLYKELHTLYPQAKDLKEVCKLLFSAAGAEIRSGGVGIEPGRLYNNIRQIRLLQAVMGPQRFFEKGWNRLANELLNLQIEQPAQLNVQTITAAFVDLILSDYPNAAKAMQAVNKVIPENIGRKAAPAA